MSRLMSRDWLPAAHALRLEAIEEIRKKLPRFKARDLTRLLQTVHETILAEELIGAGVDPARVQGALKTLQLPDVSDEGDDSDHE